MFRERPRRWRWPGPMMLATTAAGSLAPPWINTQPLWRPGLAFPLRLYRQSSPTWQISRPAIWGSWVKQTTTIVRIDHLRGNEAQRIFDAPHFLTRFAISDGRNITLVLGISFALATPGKPDHPLGPLGQKLSNF